MANLYNVPLENSVQLTLQNSLTAGSTSTITFTSSVVSKLQASSSMKGILVIDRIDSSGTETPTKTEIIAFTGVSGSTVTGLTRGLSGTTDQDHSVGAIVEFMPDITWAQAINDVFNEQHNSNGTHKTLSNISLVSTTIASSIINGGSLASVTITTSTLDTTTFNTNNAVFVSNVSGAVNQITFTNSLTSLPPKITATGSDTNIPILIQGKGTGGAYPQIKYGYTNSNLNLSPASTSYVDISNCSFTFTPQVNSVAFVNATIDIETTNTSTAGSVVLDVNGSNQSAVAVGQGIRNTVYQQWMVSLNANTSYTIKLKGSRAFGAGTVTIYTGNTTLSYILFGQ